VIKIIIGEALSFCDATRWIKIGICLILIPLSNTLLILSIISSDSKNSNERVVKETFNCLVSLNGSKSKTKILLLIK
jgi:hypothetical protein